ncbi:MAG: response regulator [Deltaproteobacteria bacterium]|nr:response regulator [Deltaproteobacteria bacterium]
METNDLKILAIDDNRDNLTALKAVMSDRLPGARLLTALDGPKGIAAARAEDPDVILLDIVMPGMDGYAVCRKLKEDERLRAIPVVFLTALRTDRESRVKALETGAEGFLSKPLDEVELTAQIRAMAKIKAANQLRLLEKEQLAALIAERTRELEQELTERKRAEEDLRRQTAVTAAINRVLQGSFQARTNAEVARIGLSEAQALTGSKFGWIGEVNPSGLLDIIALSATGWGFRGIPGARITTLKGMEIRGIFGRVLKDGKSLITNAPDAHPDWMELPKGHPELTAFLGVPLKQDGRIIGMVTLCNKPLGYAMHDQEAIEALSVAFVAALERKQTEAERERLMMAIEQVSESITITDSEGTIQYVNPAFEKICGYTRQETVGQNPRILRSGRQDGAFYRELWETITNGKTWTGQMVNRHKNGSRYTVEASIAPVFDASGRIVNYVAVKHDITEQLRLAAQFQQAQKMESIGRLAGGVAHDFNNMLNVILGYVELAMEKVAPEDSLQEDLKEIASAGRRSVEITRQLLAFARKQTISPQVIDVNETVESMLKMLRRLIGENIELAWLSGADPWPVFMDPSQVDQILANLCVNARDAIADVGKVTIETENVNLDEAYCAENAGIAPGDFVLLAVSDTGFGMDRETRDKIFEPFFTTKGLGKGTGLGLATVYGIVKQNNGFIDVYSEPGVGTTFKIYLPRHPEEIAVTPETRMPEIPIGHGETILVVEDEAPVLALARTILENAGYTVLTADTPDEAIRLAGEHTGRIHLLITDVIMPEMNGRNLAARLQESLPAMKCLFMSGYTADAIAHPGVLEPGIHFLQKPFSVGKLAARVRELLQET